eukprot:g14768.t1
MVGRGSHMEKSNFTAKPRSKRSDGGVDGDNARKGGGLKPAPVLNALRRSCDACRRRKKKCDGERPCRRCLGVEEKCTYSKRRWPWPSSRQQQQRQPRLGVHRSQVLLLNPTSLKRCRLSASPATGLVGMRENYFLSDFFSCIGVMPLTTRSYIRETMVKLMATPADIQQPGAVLFYGAGEAYFGTAATEDVCGDPLRAIGPSTCTFWCAVAVGALAQGSPIGSVSRYCQLARHGLRSSPDPAHGERAMAWAILAYVYLFCGNTDMFQEYMKLSESCLHKSIEQGSFEILPLGFAEIVHHRKAIKCCCKDAETGQLESIGDQVQLPPDLREATTEPELYTFMVRSYGMLEQDLYRAAKRRSDIILSGGDSNDVERDKEGEKLKPRLAENSTEMLDTMEARLKQYARLFERLEEVVERPNIRSGVGGVIINWALFLQKTAVGDLVGALERIRPCVEVFERFPGLCRFTVGAHAVHVRISALAAIDDCRAQELYRRLRAAYNSHRLPGTAPVPPLEEWQGVSGCCDEFYCRTMEPLISRIILSGAGSGIRQEGSNGEDDGLLLTSAKRNVTVAPLHSGSMGVELDLPYNCKANPSLSRPIHRGNVWQTGSTQAPASPSANCETPDLVDTDLASGRTQRPGEVVQAPGALLVSPEVGEKGGMADGTENDNRLVAEDWLDVAHALSETVADL